MTQNRGARNTKVQYAIVRLGCNNLTVIEESSFRIDQVCWAKWKNDVRSHHYQATKLTGYCFSDGPESGYAFMHFVDENKDKSRKGKKDYQWRSFNQIRR